MPIVREFRSKKVKRTKKNSERIVVILQGAERGLPGQQIEVSLAEFLAERKADFHINPNSQSSLDA